MNDSEKRLSVARRYLAEGLAPALNAGVMRANWNALASPPGPMAQAVIFRALGAEVLMKAGE